MIQNDRGKDSEYLYNITRMGLLQFSWQNPDERAEYIISVFSSGFLTYPN
jgi:hypothetical protein